MRIMIFGATGMVGQGVLLSCLAAPDVARVRAVGRTATGVDDARLDEVVHADLFDLGAVEERLQGFDACFFCLGVSAIGMSEADYTSVTHDLTLATAAILARLNPQMTFVYVSGAHTDSSERGRAMWARVKGRTENALQRLAFKSVYLFRPGVIQPVGGVRTKTRLYDLIYAALVPPIRLVNALWPGTVISTDDVGRAMLAAARHGYERAIVEIPDIKRLARG
jgi:uncharacterized protein YbjT (DUF2867 family)